jgi:ribosomal protein L13E
VLAEEAEAAALDINAATKWGVDVRRETTGRFNCRSRFTRLNELFYHPRPSSKTVTA